MSMTCWISLGVIVIVALAILCWCRRGCSHRDNDSM